MSVIDSPLRFSQCRAMVTHDEIRDELLRRLEKRDFSAKAIADLLGVAPARISEVKKGTRQIQQDEMVTLARFFGMEAPRPEDAEPSIMMIPVIGSASAGNWREAVTFTEYRIPYPYAPSLKRAFAVEVIGDSMSKVMPEGGHAYVNPDDTRLYDGKVYLISNHEFEATIKRYRNNPARFVPDSYNSEHEPIFADEHQINVIGRVFYYGGDGGL